MVGAAGGGDGGAAGGGGGGGGTVGATGLTVFFFFGAAFLATFLGAAFLAFFTAFFAVAINTGVANPSKASSNPFIVTSVWVPLIIQGAQTVRVEMNT